jgi:hypothetical protein
MTRPNEKGCSAVEGKDFVRIEDAIIDRQMRDMLARDAAKADPVNSPAHYNQGGIEAIEGIEASMVPEAYAGYLKGNIMKYLWRYEKKEKPVQDLKKARWYLDRLISALEGQKD